MIKLTSLSLRIEKGRVQQEQKKLDIKRSKLDWGVPLDSLPVMEWDDFKDQAKNGRGLVAIAVSGFSKISFLTVD